MDFRERTRRILGDYKTNLLINKRVVIFGIGGVGGYVCEALVRAGIENFVLVDKDVVDITNLNRQIHSTSLNIGMSKICEMAKRMKSINPRCIIIEKEMFVDENSDISFMQGSDYIIDAVDDTNAKVLIVKKANELNIPIISSMGTANKLDPLSFKISDIYKTTNCPLSKVMRKKLKDEGIKKLKVIYSDEPVKKRGEIGTISYMPATCGLVISSFVIKELVGGF